jgi:pimeloyl-ACP methyl ester carboxylesterase
MPTPVIHGTADAAIDFSHAASAAKRTSGSELVPIEGAGHAVWFAHDEHVESLVVRFLSERAPNDSTQ